MGGWVAYCSPYLQANAKLLINHCKTNQHLAALSEFSHKWVAWPSRPSHLICCLPESGGRTLMLYGGRVYLTRQIITDLFPFFSLSSNRTPFGIECEVVAATKLNPHKAEDLQNHFCIVMGSPAHIASTF